MPALTLDDLKQVIAKHWGYHAFRPLQEPAMRAVLEGRDSLVVLPTGGGKSLCYQAPAVLLGGTTVVVSPLISLMKDQVDGLQGCGVPAVQLDSSLSSAERLAYEQEVRQGNVRLLFVSPERMALDDFKGFLQRVGVERFAIDEAHCISHWGHDFRPEYRQLKRVKEFFPQASVHAYTATATERVRRDICDQLGLKNPEVLVGNFDRPNLNYRILPRSKDELEQVRQVLDRHPKEAGIIYCIRRLEVDALADRLKQQGYNVLPYHAGLTSEERKSAQDAFITERCDVIVATVAFGMGIDRSNLRFVMHTGMPKSIEHYQQETGRSGRDGLEAECVLLFSGSDYMTWKYLIEKSVEENNANPQYLESAMHHLNDMSRYCQGAICRHKALVEYFGQRYDLPTCQACDICLGDSQPVADAVVVAQKILSCVARVQERFGVNHVVDVLRGADTEKIRSFKHDQLTTYGLLRDCTQVQVRNWVYQLLSQGVLVQDGGDRPILRLNEASWAVMKKQRAVRLLQPAQRTREEAALPSGADTVSWEGVDRDLFDHLRDLRRDLARDNHLPAYQIFGDRTLREMARFRPSTLEGLRGLYGVGAKKLSDWGELFLTHLTDFCRARGIPLDVAPRARNVGADVPVEPAPKDDIGVYETLGPGVAPWQKRPHTPLPRTAPVADAQVVAQKILSCVARVERPFRAGHIVRIVRGRPSDAVNRLGHDKLSTYGLLRAFTRDQVHDWVQQLIEQNVLTGDGEYNPLLTLNDASWQVLRGQRSLTLMQAPGQRREPAEADIGFWDGVDPALFEALALERTRLAADRKVAATAIFQDWVLREMARVRPSSLDKMRYLSGISDTKLADVGKNFLGVIALHCQKNKVPRDAAAPSRTVALAPQYVARPGSLPYRAFALFRDGAAIQDVMNETKKSPQTVHNYLRDFILRERPASIARWVPDDVYQRVAQAARQVGTDRLKPIFLALAEKVPYEQINLVVAHLAITDKAPETN